MSFKINNFSSLQEWLDQNDNFFHAKCLSITHPPSVNLRIANVIGGEGWNAGEEIKFEVLNLHFNDVTHFYLEDEAIFPNSFIESLEATNNNEKGISLFGTLGSDFKIEATSLEISHESFYSEKNAPHLSDESITATFNHITLPSPSDWINELDKLGIKAVWRIHGSKALDIKNVPANYEGHYLISPERVSSTKHGVFYACSDYTNDQYTVTLDRQNDLDEIVVWEGLKKVLAILGDGEVHSGNCVFTTQEWRHFIESGILPERYTL